MFRMWNNWEIIRGFRASVRSTADHYGIAQDSEGIQTLIKHADQFAELHPITRYRIQRLLEPEQWVGPWMDVLTIKDLFHELHFLTEMDLIRFCLGERLHDIDQIVFDAEGTHLFIGGERVICARGSHAVPEAANAMEQRRLLMAASLLSRLIGLPVSPESLRGAARVSWEKTAKNSWLRSTAG